MKKYCYFCACVFATLLSIGFSTSTFAEDVPAEGKTVTIASGGTNDTAYNGTATTEPYGTLFFNCTGGNGNRTQSGALTGNMNLKVQFGNAFENTNRFILSSTNNSFTGSIEVNTGTLRVDDPSSLGANKNITFTAGSLMTTSDGFDSSYTFTITEGKLCGLRATGTPSNHTIGAKITGAGSLEIVNDGAITLTNTANDYQGATYIGKNGWRSNGLKEIATLMLGKSGVLPDTTVINMGGGTVTGAIKLDLNGVDETVAGLNGTSNANIANTKAAAAASLTLNTASGQSYDYKGSITGNSATALTTINVIGAGTQDFSSTTTITNTILSVGDTATLKLKNVQTLPNLNVGANATLSAANNSSSMTLTLTGADASSIEGTLSASATNINYNGTGTLTLSNANLKTGATTITSGTLNLSDQNVFSGGLTASNCVVNVSGDSVLDSGSVVSGPLGTGALNVSNLTLNLSKASHNTNYLAINGGATFGEATIIDVSNYLPSVNISELGEITVFSAGSISGTPVFQNAPDGWIYSVDGAKIVLNYTEDTIWTWTGLSNTSFNNAENWDKGTAPVTGSDVKIHSDTTNTAKVDSDASVKTVALDAASNLQFTAGKTLTTQSMTIGGENPTLDLTGGNLTLITVPAFDITNSDSDSANTSTITLSSGTYSNVLSGNTNLTKIGPGELTLSNTNTYTGATTVSAGTLNLGIANAIESSTSVTNNATITATSAQTFNNISGTESTAAINLGTNALTLNNTVDSSYSGTITGTTSVIKTGTGTFTISGQNSYSGATTVSEGTLKMTFNVDGKKQNLAGSVTVTGEGSVLSLDGKWALSQIETTNALVTVKDGGKITIGETNSKAFQYFNNLLLDNGSISGTGNSSIRFGNINTSSTVTSSIRVTGTEQSSIDKITLVKSNTTKLTVNVDNNSSLLVPNGIVDLDEGASYKGSTIDKTGAGTFTISGESNFIGGMTISGGRIIATNASALGTGKVTNNSELEFNLASDGTCSNAIIGSGNMYKTGTGTLNIAKNGWGNYTGSITVSEGVMKFGVHDTFGNVDASPSVTINVNGGTLASNNTFTTLMNVNLAGGTINSDGGANATYGAFQIKGAITVSGDKPSYITQVTGKNYNGLHIFNNTFNVADVADGDDLIVSATLRNAPNGAAKGFTKTGAGTLTLSGENTYTGATTISEGRIKATNDSALGTGTVTNNSELEFNLATADSGQYSKVISGLGALYKSGDGTLTLSGANTYTGTTTISAGILKLSGSGVINVNSVINIAENGTLELASTAYSQSTPFANTITGAGTILQVASSAGMESDISGFTGTFKIQKDVYFTGNIDGSKSEWIVSDGAALKTVSGNTIQIKSITTDSGTYLARNWMDATDPNATYKIGSGIISGTIGYTAGTNETQKQRMSMVALEKVSDGTTSGGTLTLSGENTYTGGTTISGGTLVITNAEALGTGEITLNGGTLSTSGTIDLDENVVINANSTIDTLNGLTLSGKISGTAALTKTGAGTLTLSGSGGTYSGTTTVSAGKLSITNSSAISDSAKIIIESGAEIESNAVQTIHNLNGSGKYKAGGELTINSTLSNNIFNGTIDATGNNVIFTGTGDGCQKMSFGSSTTDGSLAATLAKLQSGRLDIKGLINAGLEITGGVFSPGNSVGSLTANSFTLNGGTALFEFDKTIGSDGAWDTLTIVDSGNITLTSGVFDLLFDDANYWHKVGEEYQLITGTTGYTTDTDLTDWLASAYQSAWSLTGKTDGIYLSANDTPEPSVPEPSTWALLILGALGMMYFRRKK